MDNLTSYRLTLLFIFAIVVPSIGLSFVSLGAIANQRDVARARMVERYREEGRELAAALERRLSGPGEEIERALGDTGGRARTLRDLVEPVSSLAAVGRTFRAAALLGPAGTVVGEGAPRAGTLLASAAGGANVAAGAAAPVEGARSVSLDEIFRPAEDLEFRRGDLEGALQKIEEIERAYKDDEAVRAEALVAKARLRARLDGFPHNAYEAYHDLVTRYPLARDRDGTVLSLGARVEIAAIWRRLGNDASAARALEDLVRFTARYEDEMRPAEAAYYRDLALARLSEIDPALAGSAAEAAEAERRDRQAARAFAATLKGPLLAKLKALLDDAAAGRNPPACGYVRAEPGRPPVRYHIFMPRAAVSPPGEGRPAGESAPLALAAFEVDLEGLRAREFAPLVDGAGTHDEGFFRLVARAAAGEPGAEEICRQPLGFPLDDLDLVAFRREPASQDPLAEIADRMRTWAIWVALVGLAAGAFVMTRAVRKEMKVAELKSDFVTTVTHELKTPLTSIGMFAETLLMGRVKDADEQRECLEIIAKETDRLTRLIDRVLTFSKIEARKKRFDLKLTDLGRFAEETIELFKTQMRGAPKPFTIDLTMIHEVTDVLCDRGSLQEVLLNLLSNAYKYGGEQKRIQVTVSKRRRWALVEVRDWGVGIPRAEQKRIFRKFYRTNDLLTRDVEGSGIGLTLARSIARAHRGDITVRSKFGSGSAFTVWLPR